MAQSPHQILTNYLTKLDEIFGFYTDSFGALGHLSSRYEALKKKLKMASGDKLAFGKGPPAVSNAKAQHVATIGNLIDRNKVGGLNYRLLTDACLVNIYTVWDTEVRPNYASSLGVDQSEINSDVMGDLRHYRNAIVHYKGLLQRTNQTLNFVNVGDPVVLEEEDFTELLGRIFWDLEAISISQTGESLKREFEIPV